MTMLDDAELKFLKQQLSQRREILVQQLLGQLKESGDMDFEALAGKVRDTGDESVASMLGAISAVAAEQETRELAEVEAALDRIARNTYGICTGCGEAIAPERLRASPAAAFCIRCQQKAEGPAGGRDPTPTL